MATPDTQTPPTTTFKGDTTVFAPLAKEVNSANKVLSNKSIKLYDEVKKFLNLNKTDLENAFKFVIDEIKTSLKHEDEKANVAEVQKVCDIALGAYTHSLMMITSHTTYANIREIVSYVVGMESKLTAVPAKAGKPAKPAEILKYTESKGGEGIEVNFGFFHHKVTDMLKTVLVDTKSELGLTQKGDMLMIAEAHTVTTKEFKHQRKIYSNKLHDSLVALKKQFDTDIDDRQKIANTFGIIAKLKENHEVVEDDLDNLILALQAQKAERFHKPVETPANSETVADLEAEVS